VFSANGARLTCPSAAVESRWLLHLQHVSTRPQTPAWADIAVTAAQGRWDTYSEPTTVCHEQVSEEELENGPLRSNSSRPREVPSPNRPKGGRSCQHRCESCHSAVSASRCHVRSLHVPQGMGALRFFPVNGQDDEWQSYWW
jgi:hypothetical protein